MDGRSCTKLHSTDPSCLCQLTGILGSLDKKLISLEELDLVSRLRGYNNDEAKL